MNIHPKGLQYLAAIVVGFGVLLRVLYLDADPQYYAWSGYITDEGRWIYQAREMFLFHAISRDYLYEIHLILAPLFQLVNYFIFNLVGPSIISSRVFTAFCGCALLLLFWKYMYRDVTPQAVVVGLVLLAVQIDFVVLSRIAVPEMVTVFFQALVYYGLVAGEPSRRRLVLLGALTLIAVAMKATIALLVGIFSLIILFNPRDHGTFVGRPLRWQNLLWFWIGFAAPLLISSAIWIGCCAPDSLLSFANLSAVLHITTLSGFVRISDVYPVISFFFNGPLNPELYILAIGLWLTWLAWNGADRKDVDSMTRRYLATSTIWIVVYLVLMLTLDYFPQRYMVHIVLPMVINVTVGINLLQKVGVDKVLAAMQRTDRAKWLRLSVFVLPTAVFLAPLLASVFALGGIDPDRLASKLACVALSVAATVYIAGLFASRDKVLKFFAVFPVIQMCLWVMFSAIDAEASLWPTAYGDSPHAFYFGSVAVATMIALAVTFTERAAVMSAPRLVTIYALGYLVAFVLRLAPAYTDPHFTIKNASQDLGVLLAGEPSIATFRAEGLFNDNRLRYQRFDLVHSQHNAPEIVVAVFEDSQVVSDFLKERYRVISSSALYVSPQFHETHPNALLPTLKVYKKSD